MLDTLKHFLCVNHPIVSPFLPLLPFHPPHVAARRFRGLRLLTKMLSASLKLYTYFQDRPFGDLEFFRWTDCTEYTTCLI